jgi:catechol 2,3-dioxygenase-like lactoylglutathione lyase family enzyme
MSHACMFEGVDTVIVRVRDVEAARAWYGDLLGCRESYGDAAAGIVVFECGGPTTVTLFALAPGESAQPHASGCWPVFRVRDAEGARAELASRGIAVEPLQSDGTVRWFDFLDPEGNRLEACEVLGAGWG